MSEVHQPKWDNCLRCNWEPQRRVDGVPQVPSPKEEPIETTTLLGGSRMAAGGGGEDMSPNMGTTW